MIVVLLNVYLVLLFILVKTEDRSVQPVLEDLAGHRSLLLLIGLFIPMNWGAPQGPALVVRNSVQIVPDVAGEVIEVPVEPNKPLKAGDVLFRIDPAPYEAQVQALEAQLKFQELRLSQMTQLQPRGPAAPSTSSSGRPRSINSRRRSTARNGIWTRPSCARRPTAT